MESARAIETVAECYAHALKIEQEAALRYGQFAEHLADRGNDATAALFRQLERFESEHAKHLAELAAGMQLPELAASEYSWLDDAPPEKVSHELIFHFMTPYDALVIALAAEHRAREFFDDVATRSPDPETRSVAAQMREEEIAHIGWIEQALAQTPRPIIVSEESDLIPVQ